MNIEPIKSASQEIDLIDLFKAIWSRRNFIIKIALIGVVVGIVISFSIPREYTSKVILAPEGPKTTAGGSNLSDLASLAGVNMGKTSSTDGINISIYPDVINSTPFMVELIQVPVEFDGRVMPLYNYMRDELSKPWWSVIVGAPMRLIGWMASIGKEKERKTDQINPLELTREQYKITNQLRSKVNVVYDKKIGVISASLTTQNAKVSAVALDSLVGKFETYIASYRTEKARRDLDFNQKLYEDSKQKYYDAQSRYAYHQDAYRNVTRESVKIEGDRLNNEQRLAYGVYNEMAQQLEMAKIKVQEQTPCITIIEPASIPVNKSNSSKLVIMFAFAFLSGFVALCIIVGKYLFYNKDHSIE